MSAQIYDRLIEKEQERLVASCPPLPPSHPRIEEIAPEIGSIFNSTACIRGYQARWAIDQNQLVLLGIEGNKRLLGDKPLAADWFSGTLRVLFGQELHYVHGGFASVYEFEQLIEIDAGKVIGRTQIDNRARPEISDQENAGR